MSQPKRHPYLPQPYLCRFTRGGERERVFWVCDIEKRELRRQTSKNTAVQKHCYSRTLPDGSKDTGQKSGMTAKDAVEFMQSDRYRVNISRSRSIRMMLKDAPKVTADFDLMDRAFYHAPEGRSSITTDAPFRITEPPDVDKIPKWYGCGYRHIGTKKIQQHPTAPAILSAGAVGCC